MTQRASSAYGVVTPAHCQPLLTALLQMIIALASHIALILSPNRLRARHECHASSAQTVLAERSRDNQETETAAADSHVRAIQRTRTASAMRHSASPHSVHPTGHVTPTVMLGPVPSIPVGPSMGTPAHPNAARTEILGTSPRMTAREAISSASSAGKAQRTALTPLVLTKVRTQGGPRGLFRLEASAARKADHPRLQLSPTAS